MTQTLRQGSIIWIEVADRRGIKKTRPVVVITASNEIVLDSEIVGLAITSTFEVPVTPPRVLLPSSPYGHPATGLRKPSVVVCDWPQLFRPSEVSGIEGYVPRNALLRILEMRRCLE